MDALVRNLLPTLLLAACATTGSALDLTTIEVVNDGIDALAIYENGNRVGSVNPGQTVCIAIRRPGRTQLTARAVGGDRTTSAPMDTNSSSWTWRVRKLDQFDALDTMPAARC